MSAALHEALRARFAGRVDDAAIPTVRPSDEAELLAALALVREAGGRVGRDVQLALSAFQTVERIEPNSATARVGAGLTLDALDRQARRHGLCIGPFSPRARALELGAFLEGEYAGLRAIPGGRLEPFAASLRAVLPGGVVYESVTAPRSATGPGLEALLLGGRGRLGVIVSAVVRLVPMPGRTEQVTVAFPEANALTRALRRAIEQGAPIEEALLYRRASAHVAHVRFAGTDAGAVRDANTFARAAAAEHGRLTDPDLPLWTSRSEQELPWAAVDEALIQGRPLRLHRVALESVIAEQEAEARSQAALPGWFDAVCTAVDPDGASRGNT